MRISDWSSDVCSSDLAGVKPFGSRSMFESLSDRLGGVFDRLRGRGALSEADVREAMREVRVALLEADVALPVARSFVDKVTEQARSEEHTSELQSLMRISSAVFCL